MGGGGGGLCPPPTFKEGEPSPPQLLACPKHIILNIFFDCIYEYIIRSDFKILLMWAPAPGPQLLLLHR